MSRCCPADPGFALSASSSSTSLLPQWQVDATKLTKRYLDETSSHKGCCERLFHHENSKGGCCSCCSWSSMSTSKYELTATTVKNVEEAIVTKSEK